MEKRFYYKYENEDGDKGYLCIDINYKKLPKGYTRITQEQFEQAKEQLDTKAK